VTSQGSSDPPPVANARPRVAVAIPCYNEAAAIAHVLARWRVALPDAEIVVFDNNSSDGTGAIAREMGVRVVDVPRQGKGYAVRALFDAFRDRDAVVLVDGDGTYPAEHIGPLLEPVLSGQADMTVGARRPIEEAGAGAKAMAPVRSLGNLLINAAFRILIGPGNSDLLSGYRVFGPGYLRAVTPRSGGFEIETELASEAVAKGLRVVEAAIPYHPRFAGTVSKLRAFRDGRRILFTIVAQSVRLRPWRPFLLLGGVVTGAWLALWLASGRPTP
jgi:glycosyltransferase involved in cell wall biosynthesis